MRQPQPDVTVCGAGRQRQQEFLPGVGERGMTEMENLEKERTPLGIYVHIPFCVRKCNYCDFLSAPADEEVKGRYLERLLEEIGGQEDGADFRVESVFFGGGTPSILEGEAIAGVMEKIREKFPYRSEDWEVTVECNPGTVTRQKLETYRRCGVNRVSFGLQSADNGELGMLGRIHTWEDFVRNYTQAREAGLANISVDLMSGLPGQTEASWRDTLRRVLELEPEHISAYSLIIEEGTPFYDLYGEGAEDGQDCQRSQAEGGGQGCQGKDGGRAGQDGPAYVKKIPPLPDEEAERNMYYDTKRILGQAGYDRYEISNYSRPGFESRHNQGYWQRKPYIGFGLGASSQLGRLRWKNTDSLKAYLGGDFAKREVLVLTRDNEIEETMYLGLRMMRGVDLNRFKKTFGVDARVIYQRQLQRLEALGLVWIREDALGLTDRGVDVSNQVLAEFLLD